MIGVSSDAIERGARRFRWGFAPKTERGKKKEKERKGGKETEYKRGGLLRGKRIGKVRKENTVGGEGA